MAGKGAAADRNEVEGEGSFVKEELGRLHSYRGNELLKSSEAITQVTLPEAGHGYLKDARNLPPRGS